MKLPPPRTLNKFGITAEQYIELWNECDGECPICLKPFGYGPRVACIDHDHSTFETRGVLCSACNFWLGTNHDDGPKLRRAADYLALPPTYGWNPVPRIAGAPPLSKGD